MILENRCTRIVFKGGFIIFQAEQNNELKNLKPKFKRLPHVFFFFCGVFCMVHLLWPGVPFFFFVLKARALEPSMVEKLSVANGSDVQALKLCWKF